MTTSVAFKASAISKVTEVVLCPGINPPATRILFHNLLTKADSMLVIGSGNDLSPSGLDGTLLNNPTFSSINGGSLTFDGTDDSCYFGPNTGSLPTSLQGDPNFTVCGWFRSPQTFTSESTWSLGSQGNGKSFNTDNGVATDEIVLSMWGGPTFGCGELYSSTDWKFICWRKQSGYLQTSSLTIDSGPNPSI